MIPIDGSGPTCLLYAASDDAPPSRVDLSAVRRDGRRRRRRRAVAPVLAATVVAGLAAGALATLAPVGFEPVAGSPSVSSDPSPGPSAAPSEFPVDRQLFALAGYGDLSAVALAPGVQQLAYAGPRIDVFAAGAVPAWDVSDEPYEILAGPVVNGAPASFLDLTRYDGLEGIAFQWAPGAWGHLRVHGDWDDLLAAAASLRTSVADPARFWFTVSPPPRLRLALARPFMGGDEGRLSSLTFTLDGGPLPRLGPVEAYVRVSVGQYFDMGDGWPTPNATFGGRPAEVEVWGDEYHMVTLLDQEPYLVEVYVHGSVTDLFTVDDAAALALSVEILGTWEDRAQWTDDPIR
jgi:hypothetical protein